MRRVVIVGASLAGLRAAEALRAEGYDGHLTMLGAEDQPPYDRPPLSKGLLAGAVEDTRLPHPEDLAIEWRLGTTATALDPRARTVTVRGGGTIAYDGLVIATGAAARPLPGPPTDLAGVVTLRTVDDARALRALLAGRPAVLVIGGGFIGTEVASTCRTLGLTVTLVTPDRVLERALGPLGPAAATRAADHGVDVRHPATVTALHGGRRVERATLSDGTDVPADVVVVAVGARPCTDWLAGSGAVLDDGVVCEAGTAVAGLDSVVAAGDVARWPHPVLGGGLLRLEHWTNAGEAARWAARRLLHGPGVGAYAPVASFWTDQFGVRLQGVGLPGTADAVRVVEGDPAGDRFVAEYRADGVLVGAVVAGAPRALLPYRRELAAGPRRAAVG